MKRFATVISLAAAVAAIAAGASPHAGSAATRDDGVVVETTFPAAGELTVQAVAVRRRPALNSPRIKLFHRFRPDWRPQEILAVAETTAPNGTPWYRISVPMRPNGTYGWIPAADVELHPTTSQIVIDRGRRTIDVYRNSKRVLHAKVAVGSPGRETPLGHYYVAATFDHPQDPVLGVYAIETSAYSKLTDWPGGGIVGIHGTDQPWLLGQAVSHGCVRVANQTALRLKRLAPLGTPIFIKA